jgi:hypothetical protein
MSAKRYFIRQFDRDKARINMEFWTVVMGFQETLFGHDWDNDTMDEIPVFGKYNEIWKSFCDHWNGDQKRTAKADPLAFHRFAIDDTITVVTLPEQTEVQQIGTNAENQTGDQTGRPEKGQNESIHGINEITG